ELVKAGRSADRGESKKSKPNGSAENAEDPAVHGDEPPTTSTTVSEVLDGAKILDEVRAFIGRYMKMTDAQLTAVALWVAHTYAVMIAIYTPYLAVTSAEKRCAKSRLMEVLRYLVWASWLVADATPAAMFRKIEKERPTLFLDEGDALFKGNKEKAE